MQGVSDVLAKALSQLSVAEDLKSLEAVRVDYLGKNGHLTTLLKNVGRLSPEERPAFGEAVNKAKQTLQQAIQEKRLKLEAQKLSQEVSATRIDVTLPSRGAFCARLHPITQSIQRIEDWFAGMGFVFADGPELEDDYHNFSALNIPSHHPARAMHDTFYFSDEHLLRTHTSNVQIRYLETHKPPCRVLSSGRVYRCDDDVTHTPMFHQVEGMVIDKNIHMGHLKGILESFLSAFFESSVNIRLRASYFPFTEPSAEVDMSCVMCKGGGCRVCKQTGWLEVLGCGMMHPNVLQQVGIDPDRYQGFAFGMGVERLTMLRHGIPDLRLFFENDVRFLEQF